MGLRPRSVVIADFNGDGFLDIATANRVSDDVTVIAGSGLGLFSPPTSFMAAHSDASSVSAGDFNADGFIDLLTTNLEDNEVAILLGVEGDQLVLHSPEDDFSELTPNEDGSYTLRRKNGTMVDFDSDGLQTSVMDRNGNTTTYTYDGPDRLIAVTDAVGLTTTYDYTSGLMSSITDPMGRVTNLSHDAEGNLTRIFDPDDTSRRFAYDGRHRLVSQISKRGFETTYAYDFAGRHAISNLPEGSTRLITASEVVPLVDPDSGLGVEANPAPAVLLGNIEASITDGNNNVTKYGTNRFGSGTRITDGLNRATLTLTNSDDLPSMQISPRGTVTESTYDETGNLIEIAQAFGEPEERGAVFEYESTFNRLVKSADMMGRQTIWEIDPANGNALSETRIIGQLDPAGGENDDVVTLFTYDSRGLMTSVTDANGS